MLRTVLQPTQILIIHEQDAARGSCDFERFFHVTPRDLVKEGLYKRLALPLYSGDLEKVCQGERKCCRQGEGRETGRQ